ncbi:CG16908 [Drosophila busckii]|uniref:CG16908 n=1 Tax=Drosophila busckii TaxID=30019 RepID=A0A0M4F254_DROBS|nr:uncharacterized protein LOC108601862 [Drosophila busckii]ALC45462.1 CG16908 [Drosophila busckii]
MSSLETYVTRIKPAIDEFLKSPGKSTLSKVEKEVKSFDFGQMRIFQVQILVPLVVKLDQLKEESQELRTSLMYCLHHIISKIYLTDEKGLRSILVVVLQQVHDSKQSKLRDGLSEEIKLAAVLCLTEALQRSTSDVLEAFYTNETVMVIGQILLTVLDIITHEKYRKLVIASLECLLVLFYVHDEADAADVVLRNQVANTIFIFLPKVVTVLFKTALADDKVGQTIKSLAIKALGRISCIMFEETTDEFLKARYDANAFQALIYTCTEEQPNDASFFSSKRLNLEENEERLRQLQTNPRSTEWISATAKRMSTIFTETCILRAHSEVVVRQAYADMCCLLLRKCANNLKHNFLHLLESVLALTEDEEPYISLLCQTTLAELQTHSTCAGIFDDNAEQLLDTHLNKWTHILHRCEDSEQFAELLFFKGFLRNVSANKLQLLLLVPRNLDLFVMCLLTTLDQRITRELLNEEYALRQLHQGKPKDLLAQYRTLPWRQFKYLSSERCVRTLYDIGALLGAEPAYNRIIFEHCQQLIEQRNVAMNEAIILMTLLVTSEVRQVRESRLILAELLVQQLLAEQHWHLALQPDAAWRLKANKPTAWFEQHTPGLYSSAVEVRMQDCDSDDDSDPVNSRITVADAQYNVLHTCLVLDALGHCARFIGDTFDRHIFHSLHKVLLKLAHSNTLVHQAAEFAFLSMQLALKYAEPSHFIECSTDYITFHLNSLLKRAPDSPAAVDILTVVLQYSTRGNVPHLESIFQTICEECAKLHQTENVHSYLRVFNAFLSHVSNWQQATAAELADIEMQSAEASDILQTWLNVLNSPLEKPVELASGSTTEPDVQMHAADEEEDALPEPEPTKPILPRHIELTKEILTQVIKFLPNSEQTQQILALECLATGFPLLADYENELLPLVHLVWQPLVEKFRQKDAPVLGRCFSLLHILGIHAKDFILKRSLSDVVPQLKQFLRAASAHSCTESSLTPTQEHKLQLKLLQSLAPFIRSLQIEGKPLHELLNVLALYLSQAQPKEMQTLAVKLYQDLVSYNGPFVYVTLLQRAHLNDYKTNISEIFTSMGFSSS